MTDRYAVFGNPISHSRSPFIHGRFAASTGEDLRYEALLAPLDDFAGAVAAFARAGGRGANVTVPFKEAAFRLATRRTPRADRAGAVNTLSFANDGSGEIVGDNTDGAGLLRDLHDRLGGRHVLLLGAGGAVRGVLAPLLAEHPASLFIANRTAHRASQLAAAFADLGPVAGGGYPDIGDRRFELIINATSASLDSALPPLPADCFAAAGLAYDMMYGRGDTPFMTFAKARGGPQWRVADGLGMLVEQAAEAFFVWRGVRPDTRPVLAELRAALA